MTTATRQSQRNRKTPRISNAVRNYGKPSVPATPCVSSECACPGCQEDAKGEKYCWICTGSDCGPDVIWCNE